MKSIFLTVLLSVMTFTYVCSQSNVWGGLSEHETLHKTPQNELIAFTQAQNPPAADQSVDDGGEVPYRGFNVIAIGMIVVTIAVITFVILRVFKGAEKTRKKEK